MLNRQLMMKSVFKENKNNNFKAKVFRQNLIFNLSFHRFKIHIKKITKNKNQFLDVLLFIFMKFDLRILM